MEDIQKQIEELKEKVASLGDLLKIEDKRAAVQRLQLKMAESGFWEDAQGACGVVNELKSLKGDVDDWDDLNNRLKETIEFFSVGDESLESDILRELKKLKGDYERLRLQVLFSGKFDRANAIVEINSGAGGTEACDWANMLFRMYGRWAEDKKFKFKVLNEVRGDEAGVKNITFFIEGIRAYGLLKSERGVHRLVRISPFDANRRRHTSFASVDVLPEIKEDIDIGLRP